MTRLALTLVLILLCLCIPPGNADTVSTLYARGYTVLPQPHVAKLGSADFVFSPDFKLDLQGVGSSDIAVQVLREELKLSNSDRPSGTLRLILAPNSAAV